MKLVQNCSQSKATALSSFPSVAKFPEGIHRTFPPLPPFVKVLSAPGPPIKTTSSLYIPPQFVMLHGQTHNVRFYDLFTHVFLSLGSQ